MKCALEWFYKNACKIKFPYNYLKNKTYIGAYGRAHNPKVVGSNPAPATTKAERISASIISELK